MDTFPRLARAPFAKVAAGFALEQRESQRVRVATVSPIKRPTLRRLSEIIGPIAAQHQMRLQNICSRF